MMHHQRSFARHKIITTLSLFRPPYSVFPMSNQNVCQGPEKENQVFLSTWMCLLTPRSPACLLTLNFKGSACGILKKVWSLVLEAWRSETEEEISEFILWVFFLSYSRNRKLEHVFYLFELFISYLSQPIEMFYMNVIFGIRTGNTILQPALVQVMLSDSTFVSPQFIRYSFHNHFCTILRFWKHIFI